jgi:beta-phosphoglucomutase-like phosphatase (HAD superfamily)
LIGRSISKVTVQVGLGVEPRRGILFEDAIAGVEAGRRGGFGQVVGVDLGDHAAALVSHGADVVIADVSEVAVATG